MKYSVSCYLSRLARMRLFEGLTQDEIRVLTCLLGGDILRVPPGTELAGGSSMYLILSGQLHLTQPDLWGGESTVDCLNTGEVIALQDSEYIAVTNSSCTLLQLQVPADAEPPGWDRVKENLLAMKKEKEMRLLERVDILSRRSVRGRILTWLSYESQRHGDSSFHIHMDRKAMADYLCVDQTALSTTLVALQKEGLVQVHGSRFTLHPQVRKAQDVV